MKYLTFVLLLTLISGCFGEEPLNNASVDTSEASYNDVVGYYDKIYPYVTQSPLSEPDALRVVEKSTGEIVDYKGNIDWNFRDGSVYSSTGLYLDGPGSVLMSISPSDFLAFPSDFYFEHVGSTGQYLRFNHDVYAFQYAKNVAGHLVWYDRKEIVLLDESESNSINYELYSPFSAADYSEIDISVSSPVNVVVKSEVTGNDGTVTSYDISDTVIDQEGKIAIPENGGKFSVSINGVEEECFSVNYIRLDTFFEGSQLLPRIMYNYREKSPSCDL